MLRLLWCYFRNMLQHRTTPETTRDCMKIYVQQYTTRALETLCIITQDNAKKIHDTAKKCTSCWRVESNSSKCKCNFRMSGQIRCKITKEGSEVKSFCNCVFLAAVMFGSKKSSPDEPKLFSCTRPENEEDSVLLSNETSQVTGVRMFQSPAPGNCKVTFFQHFLLQHTLKSPTGVQVV